MNLPVDFPLLPFNFPSVEETVTLVSVLWNHCSKEMICPMIPISSRLSCWSVKWSFLSLMLICALC